MFIVGETQTSQAPLGAACGDQTCAVFPPGYMPLLRSWGEVLGVSFYKHFAPTGATRIRPMRKAKAAHCSVVHRIFTVHICGRLCKSLEISCFPMAPRV